MATTTTHAGVANALAAEVARQNAEAETAYLELIRAHPPEVNFKKLLAVAEKAGRTHQQVETDLLTLNSIEDARAAVVDLAPIQQELVDIGQAMKAHHEEDKRIDLERQATLNELMGKTRRCHQRAESAHAAMRRLADLEAANWKLLGNPDPTAIAPDLEFSQQAQAETQAAAAAELARKAARIAELEYRIKAMNQSTGDPEVAQKHLTDLQSEIATLKAA